MAKTSNITVTAALYGTMMDAWAANSDGGARTENPFPSGGTYVEPARYMADENIYIKGWLTDENGYPLPEMLMPQINVYIDGELKTTLYSDFVTGEFFGNIGKLAVGDHTVECIFPETGMYAGCSDTVLLTIQAPSTVMDAWAVNSDKGARTVNPFPSGGSYVEPAIYLPSEKKYIMGYLETDAGSRLSGMSIDVYIDGVQQTPAPLFTTNGNGEFFGEINVPLGIHAVECIFWAWGGYAEAKATPVDYDVRKLTTSLNWITEPPLEPVVDVLYMLEVELKHEFGNPVAGKEVKMLDTTGAIWHVGLTGSNGRHAWNQAWDGAGTWTLYVEFAGDTDYEGC